MAELCEAFNRDYVYVHDRPDALMALGQLHYWFDDYNEGHPHKGLKMRPPREFIRSQAVNQMRPANQAQLHHGEAGL